MYKRQVKTTTFGAFISLLPGKDGLLHISEIRKLVGGKRIDAVEDVLNVGDKVQVELKEIDQRGKLSLGAVVAEDGEAAAQAPQSGKIGGGSADRGAADATSVEDDAERPAPVTVENSITDDDALEAQEATQSAVDGEGSDSSDDSEDEGGERRRPRRRRGARGGRARGGSEGSED